MRSEFQDVFKDAYDHWIDDACCHRYHASKSLALQVWQHQQSKIDELQKGNDALVHVIKSRDIQLENEKHEYDELMNKLVDSGMKNTELQKRVDAAIYLLPSLKAENDLHGCDQVECQIELLEQALKGESNG